MSEVNVKLMFLVCFCLCFFFYSVYVFILIFGSYLIRIVINLIKNLLWVLFLFQGEEMVLAHISREADSSQCNKFEFD
jgi:hypothetical protein